MIKTDVLVIGAGPAGLSAALECSKCGVSVLVVDENDRAGGQLFKQIHKFFGSEKHFAGTRGFKIGEILLEQIHNEGVKLFLDTRAVGVLDNEEVWLLRAGKSLRVKAKKIILAAGARENAICFPGWTLPGVMSAGAAQTFSNVHCVLPGEHFLTVGAGNVGLIVSYQLLQAGANIKSVIEARNTITGYGVHARKLENQGIPIQTSYTILEARGNKRVEQAVISRLDMNGQPVPGSEKVLEVDTILLAVGLSPKNELPGMFGCQLVWEKELGGFLPSHDQDMKTSNRDVYVCGDIAGVEEASTALDEGRLAGICAARDLGLLDNSEAESKALSLRQSLGQLRSGLYGVNRQKCKERIVEEHIS